MRIEVPLCQGWLFSDSPLDEAWLAASQFPGGLSGEPFSPPGWRVVDLPHTMTELPLNHFDERSYQKKGTYCREFETPRLSSGERVFLDFEGVAVSCSVWVNGRKLAVHRGAYTPFSVEITDDLTPGAGADGSSKGPNRLFVEVDAREDPAVPPFGGVVDYLVYGGIYRAVRLRFQESVFIERIFARALAPAESPAANLSVEVTVGGRLADAGANLRLAGRLAADGATLAEARLSLRGDEASGSSGVSGERTIRLDFPALEGIRRWDIDSPALYDLEIRLESGGGEEKSGAAEARVLDAVKERIGFRDARFTSRGFFLNGRRLFLRGLNRHQAWPYAGYAMGPGAQRRDAEILKRELGVNIVRTSHYPQSRHFLDACDELGLLVFTELPGWQHIGDAAWKDRALADLGDLVRRDRNHPSIVLWGVRINESPDDDDFYARTNALAAKLDPDRQRGGVRNFRKSALLEDVYTFNDFTHDGGKAAVAPRAAVTGRRAASAPYLVTEHNGHMYPAKRWDQEERLAEQARRHARVLDAAMGDPGISGAIGWCAFDYNTHKDFGSGDRICYHGVSDMFRIPKYAAALYASQKDPAEGVVLESASIFAKGERSGARVLPIEIYTNCDAVDLYHAGGKVGRFFPDRGTYPHLEHPPVVVDDLIGDRIDAEGFGEADKKIFLSLAATSMTSGAGALGISDKLRFLLLSLRRRMSFADAEALVMKYGLAWGQADDVFELVGILGGAEAARRKFSADACATALSIEADSAVLQIRPGDEWETTRVVARLFDQYGNRCPFAFEPLHIAVSGAGRLIGPADVSLLGGAAAFWVATIGREGEIDVEVSCTRFGGGAAGLPGGAAGPPGGAMYASGGTRKLTIHVELRHD